MMPDAEAIKNAFSLQRRNLFFLKQTGQFFKSAGCRTLHNLNFDFQILFAPDESEHSIISCYHNDLTDTLPELLEKLSGAGFLFIRTRMSDMTG